MASRSGRLRALLWSAALSFLILGVASGVWGALFVTNLRATPAIPWAVPAMAPLLVLLWRYLGGAGPPRRTAATRRRALRARSVAPRAFRWALLAGALGIVALAGYWIVAFDLVRMAPNALPDTTRYPWLTLALIGIMASLVSPVSEEAAFRGYAQGRLERVFPGPVAIALAAALFALAHVTQGLYPAKLLVYFLAGVLFGVLAYLTQSILPSIAVHVLGDLAFFFLIWPNDGARRLVWEGGTDRWFWLHAGQAVLFTALAVLVLVRLARVSDGGGIRRGAPAEGGAE